MAGPNLGALFAQGFDSAQAAKGQRAQRAMQKEKMGMQRERLSMDKQKHQATMDASRKAAEINQGFAAAMKKGGGEGALDYLKDVAPEYALDIETKMLANDSAIIKNEGLELANDDTKAAAIQEKRMGSAAIGMSLQAMPEEERDDAYQMYSATLQAFNPNYPSVYNKRAQEMLMIDTALSLPASERHAAEREKLKVQSDIGKKVRDRQILIRGGEPEDSTSIRAIDFDINEGRRKEQREYEKEVRAKIKGSVAGAKTLRDERVANRTSFMKKMDSLAIIRANVDNHTPNGQRAMMIASFKINDADSAVMQGEFDSLAGQGSYSDKAIKTIKRIWRGELVLQSEMDDIIQTAEITMKPLIEQDKENDKFFVSIANENEWPVTQIVPEYTKGKNEESKAPDDKATTAESGDTLEQQAQAAREAGVPEEEIARIIKEQQGAQ